MEKHVRSRRKRGYLCFPPIPLGSCVCVLTGLFLFLWAAVYTPVLGLGHGWSGCIQNVPPSGSSASLPFLCQSRVYKASFLPFLSSRHHRYPWLHACSSIHSASPDADYLWLRACVCSGISEGWPVTQDSSTNKSYSVCLQLQNFPRLPRHPSLPLYFYKTHSIVSSSPSLLSIVKEVWITARRTRIPAQTRGTPNATPRRKWAMMKPKSLLREFWRRAPKRISSIRLIWLVNLIAWQVKKQWF